MTNGTAVAPAKLTDLLNSVQQVLGHLNSITWRGIMRIADNHNPVLYANQALAEVVTYIRDWLIGAEEVNAVGEQWVVVASKFQNVVMDCQRQLGLIKNHWSGTAGEDFAAYSDQLVAQLQKASPATSGVATQLGNLAANLGTLRMEIITGGANTAIDLVKLAIGTAAEAEKEIDVTEVVITVIAPPVGIVRYCVNIAAKIAEQLGDVLKDLIALQKAVNNSLVQMRNSALAMENSVYSQLPMSGGPAEPPNLNDPNRWDPKLG